ncbi:MAG: 16S rRNA pseudouridine(516) synthase [Deltaproteobacteria bacterium]|nr:16S rRNA pseudouridine(516) synthase [Deltaproteobacteria bacterium]
MSNVPSAAPGRIDKILSHALAIPRRVAHALVRHGEVTVDGEVVTDPGQRVDPRRQVVVVDGRVVPAPGPTVLLMHKPAGVITATEDEHDRTVLDLVPADLRRRALAPVGRLDKDTTGLIVLTDDGALSHALTHPRRHVDKTYRVTFEGALPPDAAARVSAGLPLADGTTCLPASLDPVDASTARLTIHEGKHHQVKRMMAALGVVVTALHRERFGPLALPADLAPGAVRLASADEREALYDSAPRAFGAPPGSPGGPGGSSSSKTR